DVFKMSVCKDAALSGNILRLQASFTYRFQQRLALAVNEFRAEFDWQMAVVNRVDASAQPVLRFNHRDLNLAARQFPRRHQSGNAPAEDEHGFFHAHDQPCSGHRRSGMEHLCLGNTRMIITPFFCLLSMTAQTALNQKLAKYFDEFSQQADYQ